MTAGRYERTRRRRAPLALLLAAVVLAAVSPVRAASIGVVRECAGGVCSTALDVNLTTTLEAGPLDQEIAIPTNMMIEDAEGELWRATEPITVRLRAPHGRTTRFDLTYDGGEIYDRPVVPYQYDNTDAATPNCTTNIVQDWSQSDAYNEQTVLCCPNQELGQFDPHRGWAFLLDRCPFDAYHSFDLRNATHSVDLNVTTSQPAVGFSEGILVVASGNGTRPDAKMTLSYTVVWPEADAVESQLGAGPGGTLKLLLPSADNYAEGYAIPSSAFGTETVQSTADPSKKYGLLGVRDQAWAEEHVNHCSANGPVHSAVLDSGEYNTTQLKPFLTSTLASRLGGQYGGTCSFVSDPDSSVATKVAAVQSKQTVRCFDPATTVTLRLLVDAGVGALSLERVPVEASVVASSVEATTTLRTDPASYQRVLLLDVLLNSTLPQEVTVAAGQCCRQGTSDCGVASLNATQQVRTIAAGATATFAWGLTISSAQQETFTLECQWAFSANDRDIGVSSSTTVVVFEQPAAGTAPPTTTAAPGTSPPPEPMMFRVAYALPPSQLSISTVQLDSLKTILSDAMQVPSGFVSESFELRASAPRQNTPPARRRLLQPSQSTACAGAVYYITYTVTLGSSSDGAAYSDRLVTAFDTGTIGAQVSNTDAGARIALLTEPNY
ncbi:unnamed protein product [Pedinophyceae sp. YPF-701]|nr:unnamed protein product [Pedinophyceae sp. YPF-701]